MRFKTCTGLSLRMQPRRKRPRLQKKNPMMSARPVLVIEDDEFVRQTLAQHLRHLGASVIDEASDAGSARRALEGTKRYELIVADLMLPGGDAVELLRSATGRQKGAGIILISALGDGLLRSVAVLCRCRGLRVLGALRKPVRMESLHELLDRPLQTGDVRPAQNPAPKADDLQAAMERRGIGALVQPKVRALDGGLQGVEVLAHWDDPRLGAVPALRLARLADESGLSGALVQYMMGLALRLCADWRSSGIDVPVAVNLGIRDLRDLQMPELVERMLKSLNIEPDFLTLEVAEHLLLDNTDALDILSRMRMRGIRIALDNFGKGHASAVRLQRLPVCELKIDPSFVRRLPDGQVAGAVVEYAVRLAHGLGIQTTAVGVESAEQATALKSLNCDHLQGYWVSRPMHPEALPDWARSQSGNAAAEGAPIDSSQRRPDPIDLGSSQCPQIAQA